MENFVKDKSNLVKAVGILVLLACIYVIALTITEIKSYKFIGGGAPASNIISFEGKGEVFAAPDISTISFTIRETQKEPKDAQAKVAEKESASLAFLEKSGIEKKDIKTEGYNSYPKYDYTTCYYGSLVPCRGGDSRLLGYEVSEVISVKVRDLTKTGEIIQGVGGIGINETNGPNFSIENEDALKSQARKMAIDEAQAKAKVLAKDLGVRLVRIVNFSENGNYPMPYAAANQEMKAMDAVGTSAPAPQLPTGENKIISNVTITYEIR